MILHSLKDVAVDIRRQFYANFQLQGGQRGEKDRIMNRAGGLRAYQGDVICDVSLYHES